jgi:hypothetical protein
MPAPGFDSEWRRSMQRSGDLLPGLLFDWQHTGQWSSQHFCSTCFAKITFLYAFLLICQRMTPQHMTLHYHSRTIRLLKEIPLYGTCRLIILLYFRIRKKVKLSPCLIKHYTMKEYMGVVLQIHIFLTSAIVRGEWSASRPGRFTPGTHWRGGWVGLRAGLDDVEKRNSWPYRDSNSDPSVVKPVASRYTGWATPAHMRKEQKRKSFATGPT